MDGTAFLMERFPPSGGRLGPGSGPTQGRDAEGFAEGRRRDEEGRAAALRSLTAAQPRSRRRTVTLPAASLAAASRTAIPRGARPAAARSARRSLRRPRLVAVSRTTRCAPAVQRHGARAEPPRAQRRRRRLVGGQREPQPPAAQPLRGAGAATRPGLTRSTAGPPPPVGGGTAAGGERAARTARARRPGAAPRCCCRARRGCVRSRPRRVSAGSHAERRAPAVGDRVRAERGREQRVLAQVAEHVAAEQRRQPGIAHHEAADHRRVAVAVAEDEHGRREAGGRAAARAEGDVALAGGPAELLPGAVPAGTRSISSFVPSPTSPISTSPVMRSNEKRHGLRRPRAHTEGVAPAARGSRRRILPSRLPASCAFAPLAPSPTLA